PTLREIPADAEVPSHQLLLRAGYIRPLASGIYCYLYLGQRSLLKITAIVREEMDRIGQEFHLPALQPEELWQESGRWDVMGDTMFRLRDRGDRWLCLGMTHEEVMTYLARNELRSYRQLPQIWYQIQAKFRDEPRPKGGLLRTRQFTMKDSYSFDLDEEGLRRSYQKHFETYCRIFDRCGLRSVSVEASSGAMGGSYSHEFMLLSPSGEDRVARCSACSYAANLEKAVSQLPAIADSECPPPEKFPTPGQKTIEDLQAFTGLPPTRLLKTLVYMVDQQPVLVLLRGDHQGSESKLADVFAGAALRPAHPEEIRQTLGASAGSLGPVGVQGIRILADKGLEGRQDLVCGANEDDFHLRHVTPGRDFVAEFCDLREVRDGDLCAQCGALLRLEHAIEVGHIFQLGKRYSEKMGAQVLDRDGKEVTLWMGSYGIGIERILAAAVEQNHDANGMILPPSIAPFSLVVVPVNAADPEQVAVAEEVYEQARNMSLDTILDDRPERAGVKFKDADLIGIPFRITVGRKVTSGMVEVLDRSTRQTADVKIDSVIEFLRNSQWFKELAAQRRNANQQPMETGR
ncbi:MAG: proline--tRNA ligase, partial [Acidobacteria bacterium]|nr:proline--tRNA ligase [Acidobacteriota bacterium]